MEQLVKKIEDILEVENINLQKKFQDFEEWDSLSSLSIIALLDSDYRLTVTNAQLNEFTNIGMFCNFVLKNGR